MFARPSRGVLVGSTIVVGLDRVSASFNAAGPGMVAVVDLDDESVEGIELPGLKSCGRPVPVAGAPTKVVVACVGFAQPFGESRRFVLRRELSCSTSRRLGSGLRRFGVCPSIRHRRLPSTPWSAIDRARVVGVASGDFAASNDSLYLIDLASGAQELVHESSSSFVIGLSAYDPGREMLYVPDASQNAVVEFAADEGGFVELGSTTIAPGIGLAPTKVYLLD